MITGISPNVPRASARCTSISRAMESSGRRARRSRDGGVHRIPLLQLDSRPLLVSECQCRGRHGRDQPRGDFLQLAPLAPVPGTSCASARSRLSRSAALASAASRAARSSGSARSPRAQSASNNAVASRARVMSASTPTVQARANAGPSSGSSELAGASLEPRPVEPATRAGEVIRLDALQRHQRHWPHHRRDGENAVRAVFLDHVKTLRVAGRAQLHAISHGVVAFDGDAHVAEQQVRAHFEGQFLARETGDDAALRTPEFERRRTGIAAMAQQPAKRIRDR